MWASIWAHTSRDALFASVKYGFNAFVWRLMIPSMMRRWSVDFETPMALAAERIFFHFYLSITLNFSMSTTTFVRPFLPGIRDDTSAYTLPPASDSLPRVHTRLIVRKLTPNSKRPNRNSYSARRCPSVKFFYESGTNSPQTPHRAPPRIHSPKVQSRADLDRRTLDHLHYHRLISRRKHAHGQSTGAFANGLKWRLWFWQMTCKRHFKDLHFRTTNPKP